MPLVLKDRVKETSATTGTGTLTLAGAATGFQSFAVIGNGNTTYYAIYDRTNQGWEIGVGTYSSNTLTRDTVLESSNSGNKVDFPAGTKDVFCTYPAEQAVTLDDVQTLTNKTITGTFTGSLSGNATTATTLQTARTINGTSFNGSADITTNNWGTPRTLTIGSTGKSVNGSANVSWSLSEIGAAPNTLPQVTVYTSGSGTYNVPSGCRYLEIEMVGAGGGGGGSGGPSGGGQGGNGGNAGSTTINSTLIVANGGSGGAGGDGTIGKAGGVGGTATGTANILVPGQRGTVNGEYNIASNAFTGGGTGGACAFGKSGGDGAGASGTGVVNGAGGGGGGYARTLITSPASSYTYAVGAGGAGGTAGTNGFAGEAGLNGLIIFRAYF